MISIVSRYHDWCRVNQYGQEADYNNIAGFLISYVLINKGSTRSIHLVLGLLKRYFKLESKSWLTESDSYTIQLFVSELKYRDHSSPSQAIKNT